MNSLRRTYDLFVGSAPHESLDEGREIRSRLAERGLCFVIASGLTCSDEAAVGQF